MATIPISPGIVQVVPGVLAAAGANFALTGLELTSSNRVPIGSVLSFASEPAVASFFGAGSLQDNMAKQYFAGFTNDTQTPGAMLFAQYNQSAVAAYVRGGSVAALSLTQLQQLTGTFTAVVDGNTWAAGSVSLAAASSPSSAASIIQTALQATPVTIGTFTGVVAAGSGVVTGSIAGNVLYVTAVTSGTLVTGGTITGGTILANTVIDGQLTGTPGGIGTYAVNKTQNVPSGTVTEAYGTLTVSGSPTMVVAVGQQLSGTGVPAGEQIVALGTGAGGNGTYFVSSNTAVASTTITAQGVPPTVSYDSVSGAFIVTSGIRGPASTSAFLTGTLAVSLNMTQATGALLSQGAAPASPSAFMTSLTNTTQNWANFSTDFEPDGGPGTITQKLLFSAWVATTGNRYAYVEWDQDPNPLANLPASASFGVGLNTAGYGGTITNSDIPGAGTLAAGVMGMAAAINFNQQNGRITAAFKNLPGITAGATTQTQATNLAGNPQVAGSFGNFYNFYGAYATAASPQFLMYQRGTISGPFQWADTYWNQIWLNQGCISALTTLLTSVNSIPYNQNGYGLIEQALVGVVPTGGGVPTGPISQGVFNGVIRAGVTLSPSQIATVNQAAGKNIAPILQQQGWYLLITPPAPSVRQARGTPPMTLYYCDGESIQALTLASIVLQ